MITMLSSPSSFKLFPILLGLCSLINKCQPFTVTNYNVIHHENNLKDPIVVGNKGGAWIQRTSSQLFADGSGKGDSEKDNDGASASASTASVVNGEEEEEEVYGAKFFGGNQIKDYLFDADVEASATEAAGFTEDMMQSYNRFDDARAFPDASVRDIALQLQNEINNCLKTDNENGSDENFGEVYAKSNFSWNTPFEKNGAKSPIDALQIASQFYRRIDLAIICGERKSANEMELQWALSVIWPNMWEAKVTFSGKSLITLDSELRIIKQKDMLDGYDGKDVFKCVADQFFPTFWDVYNIAMSPGAEQMPRISEKKLFSSYTLYDIPPRLVLKPSIIDRDGRVGRNAEVLPMHSFVTAIKTTGPKKEVYSTTTPFEVAIKAMKSIDGEKVSSISWNVPLATEFVKLPDLPLAFEETEDLSLSYDFQQRRRVATIPYAGGPQDEDITQARMKLYEAVIGDGLKPRTDEEGRPIFFFLQNDVKGCFTESGLGMAIYESRPGFVKSNEVGVELE